MDVDLTTALEEMVQLKVQSGRYSSSTEVICEALRLMDERDQLIALRQDELRSKIAAGVASLRAGRTIDGEDFMAAMDADLAELERQRR